MNLFKTLILKTKKLPVGATTQRKEGTWKKVSEGKWAPVGKEKPTVGYQEKQAETHYDSALRGGPGGHYLRFLLAEDFKIKSYAGLKKKIRKGPRDTAHRIFRQAKDYIDTTDLESGDKKRILDSLGRALIKLRDLYAGTKTRLTTDIRGKTGKVYRKKPKGQYYQPSQRATTVKAAKEQLGGWSGMSRMPTTEQINNMLRKKTAIQLFGKIDPKKKWTLKQNRGRNDIIVPFRETDQGITIYLKQTKKVEKRTRRTALLKVMIPYVFAKSFLAKHIVSVRTRNELIRQIDASKGYQKFMGKQSRGRVA